MAACYLVLALILASLVTKCFSERQSIRCPEICTCLGSLVDCSKRGLTQIPERLPVWTQVLDLSDNSLQSITAESLLHLSALETLKLDGNRLVEIPLLRNKPNLTTLSLKKNKVASISMENLATLPQLTSLDLEGNHLENITSGLFVNGSRLESLILSGNRIKHFSSYSFANVTRLEVLKLNRNEIGHLAKDDHLFAGLSKLKTLELSRNGITEIEGLTFQGLSSLHVLKLKHNKISTLHDGAFFGLDKLQTLHLDRNNITNVEKGWLYGLNSLKQMSLKQNSVSSIDPAGWGFCPALEELNLSFNKLVALPGDTFRKLFSLRRLHLGHNQLSNIASGAFSGLTVLHDLDLNDNALSWTVEDMEGAFSGLEALTRLNLENNKIRSIAEHAFDGLSNLKQLDLTGNDIVNIQENTFSDMPLLKEIYFNSSSFLCDCKLSWLALWLKDSNFMKFTEGKCAHPEWLKHRSIFSIDTHDFICSDHPKPLIVKHPETQIALKGNNVTLFCSAVSSSESAMIFVWKKNNMALADGAVENTARAVDNELGEGEMVSYTSQLMLADVQDDNEGWYQCVVTNDHGSTYSNKARMDVHVFPVFTKTPVDVTVRVGSTARLECAAKGQPVPVIAWQKDGGDNFPAAQERRMRVIPKDDIFFIVNVKSSDMGVYSCTATNPAGVIAHNATLSVLEPPSFVKPMEAKMAEAGKTAVIECMMSGMPQPHVTWLKDGVPLQVTERHFFTAENQLLIIVEAVESDAGVYTCQMHNTLGKKEGTSVLKVIPADPVSMESASEEPADNSTTTGIVIIAVVCCVVGTSVIWVIIIYQTRKRTDELSGTTTDDTPLPAEGEEQYTYLPIDMQINTRGGGAIVNADSSLDSLHSDPSTKSTNSGSRERSSLHTFHPCSSHTSDAHEQQLQSGQSSLLPQGYISVREICRHPLKPPDHYGSESSSSYSTATFPRKQSSTVTASETVRWSTGELSLSPYTKDVEDMPSQSHDSPLSGEQCESISNNPSPSHNAVQLAESEHMTLAQQEFTV